MKGTYNLSGLSVDNVITVHGQSQALDVLAGKKNSLIESIVVGIGSTAASSSDEYLEFEVNTVDVTSVVVDYVNEKIYYKGVLPASDHYLINEVGCNSNSSLSSIGGTGRFSGVIYNFNGLSPWVDPGPNWAVTSDNTRIDSSSIKYTFNNTTVTGYTPYSVDLSDLPFDTYIKFAYYTDDVDSLVLRFKVDGSNYYSYSGWSITDGYHITTVQKSDFIATGSPTWDNIQTLEVSATSNSPAVLSLDSIRYDYVRNNNSQLVSRAVLSTPKQKLSGVTMDIEYVLDINI